MPSNATSRRSPSNRELIQHVTKMQEHLARLRERLYPILSEWKKHNLTQNDNFYGFVRLDELKNELDNMERKLRKHLRPAARAKNSQVTVPEGR